MATPDEIEETDIEKMKHQDILQSLLSEIKEDHPIIGEVLINERDQFLAQSIRSAPGDKIVAVVGAAHVPGILEYIKQNTPIDLDALKTLPTSRQPGKNIEMAYPRPDRHAFHCRISHGG